jgi:hypothetical protein
MMWRREELPLPLPHSLDDDITILFPMPTIVTIYKLISLTNKGFSSESRNLELS